MVNAVRALGAASECLGVGVLLARWSVADGDVRAAPFAVGFAAGYLYRHARTVAGCRRLRGAPGRTVVLALAWAALWVAVARSADDSATRRSFAAGLGVGSAGYWLARRRE